MHHVLRQSVKYVGIVEAAKEDEKKKRKADAEKVAEAVGRSKLANMMVGGAGGAGGAAAVPQAATTTLPEVSDEQITANIDEILADLSVRKTMTIVGKGGNGCVMAVEHRASPGKMFALKISQRRIRGDKDLHCDSSAIMKEYRNLTFCSTIPNVVKLAQPPFFQLGLASRQRAGELEYVGLFLDWVDTVKVHEVSSDKQWWNGAGLDCIKQFVKCVAHMHSQLLIHSDIKPGNVLILKDLSSVTVVDFGMSQPVSCGLEKYGTQGYQAPEFTYTSLDAKSGGAARDAEAWAVAVTCALFAIGRGYLVAKETDDGDRDRGIRQDRLLSKCSQQTPQTPWARDFATDKGRRKTIDDADMWKFIEKTLAYDPIGRSKALQAFSSQ